MSRGRKPGDPKVRQIAEGKLRPVDRPTPAADHAADDAPAAPQRMYPPAPAWVTDPNARELWDRFIPELIKRKKYLNLFEVEFGSYCVAFGQYVGALEAMQIAGKGKNAGKLRSVVKSSKKIDMLSQHWVVANRARETMAKLAGDLGLNAVAYQRIETLQLDLFATIDGGDKGGGDKPATSFGGFRRGAGG